MRSCPTTAARRPASLPDMPCIVHNLTDDEAITQMVEDNLNQHKEILPSERVKALKMQLEAIKHQGSRTSGQNDPKDTGKRSNEIVVERNKMVVKHVQRYIWLNELVPDLMKLMDEKKLGFTTAVELSYIGKKNQNYIAVAFDSQQSSPSQAQAKRMRELDEKKLLNGDVGGQKGGRQSDSNGCGTEQILRQGNHAEGNEGPNHQAAGRLEGPIEGTRKAGEENLNQSIRQYNPEYWWARQSGIEVTMKKYTIPLKRSMKRTPHKYKSPPF